MSHFLPVALVDQHVMSSREARLGPFRIATRVLLFATVISLGLGTYPLPGGVAKGGALASSEQNKPTSRDVTAKSDAGHTAGRVVSIRTSLLQLDRLTAASFGDH